MTPEIEGMPFDELRTLHREVGALIAQRRHEALEKLKEQIAVLGFTPADLAPNRSGRSNGKPKYGDGNGNYWSGKGRKPVWLQEKLEGGASLEDFVL
jgi:DNA-binding protein H-NS